MVSWLVVDSERSEARSCLFLGCGGWCWNVLVTVSVDDLVKLLMGCSVKCPFVRSGDASYTFSPSLSQRQHGLVSTKSHLDTILPSSPCLHLVPSITS